MSTWTTPTTFAAGPLSSTDLNTLRDDLNYLKDVLDLIGATSSSSLKPLKSRRYACRLTNSADITAANTVDKVLTWDQEDVDSTPALHSTSSNTARITIPSGGDGDYFVEMSVRWVINSTGQRSIWFEVNGSAGSGTHYGIDTRNGVATVQTYCHTSAYIPGLVAGDYITANVFQNSGGNLDVGLSAGSGQCFSAFRVSAT